MKERKTISLHVRIDKTTQDAIVMLENSPGWRTFSHYIRACVVRDAQKVLQDRVKELQAIQRADEPTVLPTKPESRESLAERHYNQPNRVKAIIAGEAVPSRLPLRRIPTAIDESDNP